jgi:ADP-ribose pyrophosphatase
MTGAGTDVRNVNDEGARIVSRRRTRLSPWVTLVEKSVAFAAGRDPEVYHFLAQADYVGVLAVLPDGRIPLVRQYRPAVETFTWEFPAGTVDPGEAPAQAARRELLEEAGVEAGEMLPLGRFAPDTGRLDIGSHAFFTRGRQVRADVAVEPGIERRFVTAGELREMIRTMEFPHQLHLGIYAAALVHGVCPELEA